MEGNESIWWVAQANRVADSGQELKSEILFFFFFFFFFFFSHYSLCMGFGQGVSGRSGDVLL